MCSVDFYEMTVDDDIHVVGTLLIHTPTPPATWEIRNDLSLGYLPLLLEEPMGDPTSPVIFERDPHGWLALAVHSLPHGLHLQLCCRRPKVQPVPKREFSRYGR